MKATTAYAQSLNLFEAIEALQETLCECQRDIDDQLRERPEPLPATMHLAFIRNLQDQISYALALARHIPEAGPE